MGQPTPFSFLPVTRYPTPVHTFNMIASLHPCITKDINILCAGRSLTEREKKRLSKARAVIVSQGVTAEVYQECRRLVPRVFPNYDLRFPLEGKVGDAWLFEYYQVPHPRTLIFRDRNALFENYPDLEILPSLLSGFPMVLKANSGGEGAFVFLVHSKQELIEKLSLLPQSTPDPEGFVLQERIDHGGKDLRVVVLFDTFYAYWRIQPNPNIFLTNQSHGGLIDPGGNALLKDRAVEAVRDFCKRSGINLAGFDLIFDHKANPAVPLFLEINYYFGRRGLGGSMRFYEMFEQAADRWLVSME
jgi:ribosomal protein S6--L-glutamate ligase